MPFYNCLACNKNIPNTTMLKRHYLTTKHKLNVINNFPDTLDKKFIGDVELQINKLDLKKRNQYIKIIENCETSKKKTSKKLNVVTMTAEMYAKEYYELELAEMVYLINNAIKFIKMHNKKLDEWFNYAEYIEDKDNEEIIICTYADIKFLVMDPELMNEIIS